MVKTKSKEIVYAEIWKFVSDYKTAWKIMDHEKLTEDEINELVFSKIYKSLQWLVYSKLLEVTQVNNLDCSAEDFLRNCIKDQRLPSDISDLTYFKNTNKSLIKCKLENHLLQLESTHKSLKLWKIEDVREVIIRHLFIFLTSTFKKFTDNCENEFPSLSDQCLVITTITSSDLETQIGVMKNDLRGNVEDYLAGNPTSSGEIRRNSPRKSIDNNISISFTEEKIIERTNMNISVHSPTDINNSTDEGAFGPESIDVSPRLEFQQSICREYFATLSSSKVKLTPRSSRKKKQNDDDKPYTPPKHKRKLFSQNESAESSSVTEAYCKKLRSQTMKVAPTTSHNADQLNTNENENEGAIIQFAINSPGIAEQAEQRSSCHEMSVKQGTHYESSDIDWLGRFQDIVQSEDLGQKQKHDDVIKLRLEAMEELKFFTTLLAGFKYKYSLTSKAVDTMSKYLLPTTTENDGILLDK